MFEKIFYRKKEEPKKKEEEAEARPSFEELVRSLPENEQEELRKLEGIDKELVTSESEDGMEIDHSMLSESEEKSLSRYYTLLKKARDILEKKKGSGIQ